MHIRNTLTYVRPENFYAYGIIPLGPRSPASPLGPEGPVSPLSPFIPISPLIPGGPWDLDCHLYTDSFVLIVS